MSGLSSEAQSALDYLVVHHDLDELVSFETIEQATTDLHGDLLNGALLELGEWSAVRVFTGRGQRQVGQVVLLPEAWLYVEPSVLGYNVQEDMRVVAEAVFQQKEVKAEDLEHVTELPAKRLNIAALLLAKHEGKVISAIPGGSMKPYRFAIAMSTDKTSRWLRNQQP